MAASPWTHGSFLPWTRVLAERWLTTGRKLSRRSVSSHRKPNGEWRVVAIGVTEVDAGGMDAVVLRRWEWLPRSRGFGAGRRGLRADRTFVLTNN
jgi:hypothetical protein